MSHLSPVHVNIKYVFLRHTNKHYSLVENIIRRCELRIYTRMKLQKTVTLDSELVKWIEQQIKEKEFGSLSHALEKAVTKLRKDYEKVTVTSRARSS